MQQKSVMAVIEEHSDKLMALPGVVGVAQGEVLGRPCIRVLVVRKDPELLTRIPKELEGYSVDIQESGELQAFELG